MALSKQDSQRLRDAGFIPEEIAKLGAAKTPTGKWQPAINLDSPAWQATIKERIRKCDSLKKQGLSAPLRDMVFQKYYDSKAKNARNIYDFLKSAYRPPRPMSDYSAALHKRVRNRKNKGMSRAVKYVLSITKPVGKKRVKK